MSVRRLSQSFLSTRGRGKASTFIAGYGFGVDEMDLIARTTVGAGGVASITFSSIPQTYQHLQIRLLGRDARTVASQLYLQYNGDTGANYTEHQLSGNGATVSAFGAGNVNANNCILGGAAASGQQAAAVVIDILEYASTSKFKTMRAVGGTDSNGSGGVRLDSGLWRSTAAITSILLYPNNPNFAQSTVASLYGVVG